MRADPVSNLGGQLDGVDDDILDMIENDESVEENKDCIVTIINTNARSLCPKIHSFIDCFEEMDSAIGIVTETWLADGDSLERDVADLPDGTGIGLVYKNRPANARGVAHGGVAVAFNRANCSTRELHLPNPDNHES